VVRGGSIRKWRPHRAAPTTSVAAQPPLPRSAETLSFVSPAGPRLIELMPSLIRSTEWRTRPRRGHCTPEQLHEAVGIHRQQKSVENQHRRQVARYPYAMKARLLANASKRSLPMDRMLNVARTRAAARYPMASIIFMLRQSHRKQAITTMSHLLRPTCFMYVAKSQ